MKKSILKCFRNSYGLNTHDFKAKLTVFPRFHALWIFFENSLSLVLWRLLILLFKKKWSPYFLNSGLSYILNFSKRKFSNVISGKSDNQCNQLWPWLDGYWLKYFISGGFISFLFINSAWNRLQNYVFGQFCDDHPHKSKSCEISWKWGEGNFLNFSKWELFSEFFYRSKSLAINRKTWAKFTILNIKVRSRRYQCHLEISQYFLIITFMF
jgi:hypothetical protein